MISVLMTSYNAQDYIADAVQSILAQTEPEFECVIIDDGSTDNTICIVKQFHDPRIRLIEAGRIGLARALNLGVRESRGEFIARHDADDLSHPKRLEIQKAAMQHFPDYSAVVSPLFAFHAEDVPNWPAFGLEKARTSLSDLRKKLMLFNPVVHTSLFVRGEAMQQIRGYDESRTGQLDWDLYVRLYENGLKLGSLEVPVAAKRIHARQFFERGARLRYVLDGVVLQDRAIRALGGGFSYRALLPLWFSYRMLPHKVRMWLKKSYFFQTSGRAGVVFP